MSQKDIDDVLPTLAATPSTPILGGYGHPELTTQDFQCSICGNIGHIADYCNNSPIMSSTKCFCCSESSYVANQCSHRGYSPTPMETPGCEAPYALSATSPTHPPISPVHPFALTSPNTSAAIRNPLSATSSLIYHISYNMPLQL